MNKEIVTPFGEIGYITYKRTYARRVNEGDINSKTEEFPQTIDRVVKACKNQLKVGFTDKEEEELTDILLNLKGMVAGRFLWQLGTNTVKRLGLPSLQNCAVVVIDSPIRPFTWAMDMLMLGSGVGFNIQRENVYQIPKLKGKIKIERKDTNDADFIVPDSREGWVKLLARVLKAHFYSGESFTFSTICVRSKDAPIRGFGGTASGPEDLCWGMEEIHKILNLRANKKVRTIDCLDIMNIIGQIVVAGNVRRSAQIAIGDYDDIDFLKAKRWDLGDIPNWRVMSNNSIICDNTKDLLDEFWETYNQGEPYGLINLKLSKLIGRTGETQYPDTDIVGYNPCQPAWATVITPKGLSTIGEVNAGDKIWSETGWTTITKKWSTGIKVVNKYETSSGVFYGTENHRLVSNGIKIEAKDCEVIDSLRGNYEDNLIINIQDVMDGLVLGDGSMHKASNNKIILNIGEDDMDYFDSEVKSLISKKSSITKYAYEVITTIKYLDTTPIREIPKKYFNTKNKLAGILRGLYSANGSVVGDRVTFKTASSRLREQIQLGLSWLGIKSYYTTNKPSKVTFSNGDYLCKESYDINISVDTYKFYNLIGFIQKYKNEKLELSLKKEKADKKENNAYILKNVEFISEEEVYDITVDNECHTYWTGGLNVSNCAEQSLANFETCCLAEIYLNAIESKEELYKVATYLYRICKHSLTLPCHNKETEEIVHKNMRMGIGITGVWQATEEQRSWLSDCYKYLREYDVKYSKTHDLPISIKLTTSKPSGTLSLLRGVTPGSNVSPAGPYFIRRIRIAASSPLIDLCIKNGYKVEYQRKLDGTKDLTTKVVEFPCSVPEFTPIAETTTALQQLDMIKEIQSIWSDNSVSVTVTYKKEELPDIKNWLNNNYEFNIKTVSFLLYSDHGFDQAPYETITKELYDSIKANVTPITHIEVKESDMIIEECAGGACPIK